MKWILLLPLTFFVMSCSTTSSSNAKKADIYFSYGTSNLMQKQYTEALDYLLKAYEIKPNDSKINTNLGMAYFFKNELSKAEMHIKKAIQLDPKNSDAKNNLASIYFNQKKYNEAEVLYQEILRDLTYEHQYRTYYNLGNIELIRRNESKAVGLFERSVQENDSYCPAYYQLAEYEFRHKNYEKALTLYRSSQVGTCYNNPVSHLSEVAAMMKMNQYSRAKIKVKEILTRFTDNDTEKRAKTLLSQIEQDGQRNQFRETESTDTTDREISAPEF